MEQWGETYLFVFATKAHDLLDELSKIGGSAEFIDEFIESGWRANVKALDSLLDEILRKLKLEQNKII